MYVINKYKYVDKKTRNKFEIFARNEGFADDLAKRISSLSVFNLRRSRFGFMKRMATDIPPYEIELEQIKTVSTWEDNHQNK